MGLVRTKVSNLMTKVSNLISKQGSNFPGFLQRRNGVGEVHLRARKLEHLHYLVNHTDPIQ